MTRASTDGDHGGEPRSATTSRGGRRPGPAGRKALTATAALFAALGAPAAAGDADPVDVEPAGPARHVVLIVADDLGFADLGCQGSRYYRTPRVDGLAKEGVRFLEGYASAPNCAPTRACLATGLYSPRHGVYTVGSGARGKAENRGMTPVENRTDLRGDLPTLAGLLRDAGFRTVHVGKWHLGHVGDAGPLERGFDVNVGGNHTGSPKGGYFSPYRNPELPDGPPGESLTARLAREAARALEEGVGDGRRVFVQLAFHAVHTPLQAREADVERWREVEPADGQGDPTYAAMVEALDAAVGDVLDTIDALGIADETLVVFTSDNGGVGGYAAAGVEGARDITRNGPLRGGKGMLYEGGVRVPWIVRGPGIPAGREDATPIATVDLLPTLLRAVGAPERVPERCDGVDLWPRLQGGAPPTRDALYWHFPGYLEASAKLGTWRTRPASSVRVGPWKLIEHLEDGRVELFQLAEDPGEQRDRAQDEPQTRDALLERLRRWRAETDAPMPTPIR